MDGVRERERAKCEPRGLLGAIAETKSRGARERERGDDGGVEKERREEESTAAAAAAAARGVAAEQSRVRRRGRERGLKRLPPIHRFSTPPLGSGRGLLTSAIAPPQRRLSNMQRIGRARARNGGGRRGASRRGGRSDEARRRFFSFRSSPPSKPTPPSKTKARASLSAPLSPPFRPTRRDCGESYRISEKEHDKTRPKKQKKQNKTHLALAGAVPSRQQRSPRRRRRRVGSPIRVDSVAVDGPVGVVAVQAVVGVKRRLLERRRALLGERCALARRARAGGGRPSLRSRRRRILRPAAARRDPGDELAEACQAPVDLLQGV